MPQRQDLDPNHEAVEVDMIIGRLRLPGNRQIKFSAALGGHPVTVWADLRSLHVLLGGELIRVRVSRLSPSDLAELWPHGARPAGPEPAASAAPREPLPAARWFLLLVMAAKAGRPTAKPGGRARRADLLDRHPGNACDAHAMKGVTFADGVATNPAGARLR